MFLNCLVIVPPTKYVRCDGEINAVVEGSEFKESHVLKILSWRVKEGGIPRPLIVYYPDL
jgi:hypothetical protein